MRAIIELFTGKPFEFFVAHPIHNVVFKLQHLERHVYIVKGRQIHPYTIEISPENEFVCYASPLKNADVHCTGRLMTQSGGVSLVGWVHTGILTKIALVFACIWFMGWTVAFVVTQHSTLFVIGLVGIIIVFWGALLSRKQLYDDIHLTFGKPVK